MNMNIADSTRKYIPVIIFFFLTAALLGQSPRSKKRDRAAALDVRPDRDIVRMNIPIKSPGDAADSLADILLKIPAHVERIDETDFFPPYSPGPKNEIAGLLEQAAGMEQDPCHRQYLTSLARGVREDLFYSHVPWPELEDNTAEILFLPGIDHWLRVLFLDLAVPHGWARGYFQEAGLYRRELKNLYLGGEDRIFDTVIYLNDREETWNYEEYARRFDRMQDKLEQKKNADVPYSARPPAIKIARLLYSSAPDRVSLVYPIYRGGDAGDFKIVIFKNLIERYTDCILAPIARKILVDQTAALIGDKSVLVPTEADGESCLSNLVMHRIAHHIGPVFTLQVKMEEQDAGDDRFMSEDEAKKTGQKGGKKASPASSKDTKLEKELITVAQSLGDNFAMVEELKAWTIALHNTSMLIDEGLIPREKEVNIYATYLAFLVDRLRRDPSDSINKAYIVQFNYLLKNGGIFFDINSKKISIHLLQFAAALEELAKTVLEKYTIYFSLLKDYGQVGPELRLILDSLDDIPENVDFRFPAMKKEEKEENQP
jgi:hypothetical protein